MLYNSCDIFYAHHYWIRPVPKRVGRLDYLVSNPSATYDATPTGLSFNSSLDYNRGFRSAALSLLPSRGELRHGLS